jgi:tetratricopeptide (TPR) repeat protein
LIYNTSPTTQSAFYAREFSGNRRYLIENRQQGNTYDDGLPHVVVGKPGGLLIWRIDGNGIYEGATSLLHADNSSGTDFSDMANDMFRPTGDYPYGKISDYSTPKNLKLSPTEFSRFAIDKFTQNANNITVDFIHNYWEGAISSNTTWSSVNNPYFVGGNITVNSGVTLTITAGTTVLFASGKKITVIGSLQALGTGSGPTEKITFDRSGASGTWNGLWIENSTANSNLNYCTVRNAATGIRLKNTSGTVTIDHATLTNNQIGFVSEYSSPFTIQNSTIQNNIAYGIWISSSAASGAMKILSNTIASNGTYHGVHLYNGADAFLGFNTITGHSQHGVSCNTNSDPHMRSVSPNPDYGNNTIKNNGGAGVKAMNNSYPLLGVNFQDGTLKDYYGYNEIHSNTGYEIENANSSGTIIAERNYWSANHNIQATPSDLYGSVDYDPVLPEIPTLVEGGSVFSLQKSSIDFEEAFALENQGELQGAVDLYLKLLHSDPDADNVGFGVNGLIRCYKGMDRRREISELMDQLIHTFPATALAASAKDHSLPYLVQRGEHELALTRAQELLSQNRGNVETEPSLLFQTAMIYRLKSSEQAGSDLSNAQNTYRELEQKYPDSDLGFFARLELEELDGGGFGKPEILSPPNLLAQRSFELKANYPNPFNPQTIIKFLLAEEQQVQLHVFDAAGRLVRTLAEGSFPKGEREISWNGKDDRGVAVASGVYFYKLIIGRQSQTRKMVLLR